MKLFKILFHIQRSFRWMTIYINAMRASIQHDTACKGNVDTLPVLHQVYFITVKHADACVTYCK